MNLDDVERLLVRLTNDRRHEVEEVRAFLDRDVQALPLNVYLMANLGLETCEKDFASLQALISKLCAPWFDGVAT